MPFEITLDAPFAGYAMEDATGIEGHPSKIAVREFTSSDDGELFVSRLEGIPRIILSKLPADARISPSTLDHLLAIIRPDLRCTVYVNELQPVGKLQSLNDIQEGQAVTENDVADITEFSFENVDVPEDAAVVCVFSAEWRKGFFFDVTPLGPGSPLRDYDLWKLLGSYYAYLTNHSVFNLTEEQWDHLVASEWFPFISLPKDLLRTLVGRARGSGNLDILVPQIATAVEQLLPRMLDRWAASPIFAPHIELLRHAAQEYSSADYVSAVAIVYPRIEGLLRSIHAALGIEDFGQAALAGRLIEIRKGELHPYSWLLPHQFQAYFEKSYFGNFTPGSTAKISRNSVGHGVAEFKDFDQKHAAVGFLILDQLYYLVPRSAV